MAKYTLKAGQQKEDIIMINGNQSICPFTNAIPMQGQMGGFQIMRMPCTTLCPHASLKDNKLSITCGGQLIHLEIESEEDTPKEYPKILSLV
jgi:hypothetical protein